MSKGYLRNVVNESYLKPINEATGSGDIYLLVNYEEYEGEHILGVYTSPEIAQKALNKLVKQDSSNRRKLDVRKVKTNKQPSFSYIDTKVGHGKTVYKAEMPAGAQNVRGLAMGMKAQQGWGEE